jgi:hypothetical protein
MTSMTSKNEQLVSQILFKKYEHLFDWLLFNDLCRLVRVINKKYDVVIPRVDVKHVRDTHKRVYPALKTIDKVKNENKQTSENLSIKNELDETIEDISNITSLKEELIMKSYNIFVDSFDRNKDKWSKMNPFQFSLGPASVDFFSEQENTLANSFSNVEQLTINHVVFPFRDSSGNDVSTLYPYVLINISEISNKTNGTNKYLNNSFGQLMSPTTRGPYLSYDLSDTELYTEKFSPRIEISKLTFTILSPDGNVIEFEESDNARICIKICVKCLHKRLTNTFLNKRG